MSMKPDDIQQWAWDKAESAFWNNQSCTFNASGFADDVVAVIARAIIAAVEEEREACAVALEAMSKTYLPGGPMDAKGGLMMGAAAIRSRQSKDG